MPRRNHPPAHHQQTVRPNTTTPMSVPQVYQYIPHPLGIGDFWKHDIQLLCYLYYNPDERARLQRRINVLGMAHNTFFIIIHPCLSAPIGLRVGESDFSFQFTLKYALEDWDVKVPAPVYLPHCMSTTLGSNHR